MKNKFLFLFFFLVLIFISGCFKKDNFHCVNYVRCDICIQGKQCNDYNYDLSLKTGENQCFMMAESEIVKLEKLNCDVNISVYFVDEYMEKYKFEEFDNTYLVTFSDVVEKSKEALINE